MQVIERSNYEYFVTQILIFTSIQNYRKSNITVTVNCVDCYQMWLKQFKLFSFQNIFAYKPIKNYNRYYTGASHT